MVQTSIAIGLVLTLTVVIVLLAIFIPRSERFQTIGMQDPRCSTTGMTAGEYEVRISEALEDNDWEAVFDLYGQYDSCFRQDLSTPLKVLIRANIHKCKGEMCDKLREEVQT